MIFRHDEFYVNDRDPITLIVHHFYHFFNVIGPLQKFSESYPFKIRLFLLMELNVFLNFYSLKRFNSDYPRFLIYFGDLFYDFVVASRILGV